MNTPIQNSAGETLDYTFHAGDTGSDWVVVLGHGVTGNKDRPFVVALGEALEAAGLNALRFSFSGNGESGGRFVDSTISKEVDDLGAVLDALNGKKIAYVGHSQGGAVGVLRTAKDDRIAVLVSLAGMVHTAEFVEREFGMEKPDEGCMWEDEDCPLSSTYMNDAKAIGNVLESADKIHVPWLLVHGTEDDVVFPRDSDAILAKVGDRAELLTIPGANHVFADAACQPMCEQVVAWLKGKLV